MNRYYHDMVYKMFKLLVMIVSAASVVIIGGFIWWQYLVYLDQPTVQASHLNPLNGNIRYVISNTNLGLDTEPFLFSIRRLEEPETAAWLAWRRIGQTPLDLNQFLEKPVYITGKYYMGTPLTVKTTRPVPDQYGAYLGIDAVIRIEKVEVIGN